MRHHHHQSIDAEGEPTVRGRPVLECLEEETKPCVRLFLGDPDDTENPLLKRSRMDSYAPTPEFDPVQHKIVRIRQNIKRRRLDTIQFILTRGGERVMRARDIPFFIEPEEGEVRHPQEIPFLLHQPLLARDGQPERSQRFIDPLSSKDEDEIPFLCVESLHDRLQRR